MRPTRAGCKAPCCGGSVPCACVTAWQLVAGVPDGLPNPVAFNNGWYTRSIAFTYEPECAYDGLNIQGAGISREWRVCAGSEVLFREIIDTLSIVAGARTWNRIFRQRLFCGAPLEEFPETQTSTVACPSPLTPTPGLWGIAQSNFWSWMDSGSPGPGFVMLRVPPNQTGDPARVRGQMTATLSCQSVRIDVEYTDHGPDPQYTLRGRYTTSVLVTSAPCGANAGNTANDPFVGGGFIGDSEDLTPLLEALA